jgi:hypothetical protein
MYSPVDGHPPISTTFSNGSELASGTSSAITAAGPAADKIAARKIPSSAKVTIFTKVACLIRIKGSLFSERLSGHPAAGSIAEMPGAFGKVPALT